MTAEPVPLPAHLEVRTPGPRDAEALTELVAACDMAVLGRSDATLVQTTADLANPQYDRENGGALVVDGAGLVVGWLWSELGTDDLVFVDAYSLVPDVTRWLLARGVAYAQSVASARGRPIVVDSGSFEDDRVLGAALTAQGLTVRRRFYRMRIDLAGGDWSFPELPSGVVLRKPDPTSEESYRVLHHVIDSAFMDHWDHTPSSYEEWRERFDATAGLNPDQWWLLEVDGVPAAVAIGDNSRAEIGMAWVRTLSVLREFRGRGLARLLLRVAFASAASRGLPAVGLSVDSENPTGATALYESVGMHAESVLLAWKRELAP